MDTGEAAEGKDARARARFIMRIVDRGLDCERGKLSAAICEVERMGGSGARER